MPYPPSPARLSPESLSTTRLTGPSSDLSAASFSPPAGAASSNALAPRALKLVVNEAPDDYVLAEPLDRVLQEVPDGLVRVFDVLLGEEGPLFDELVHPALNDLGLDVLGLARVHGLLLGYGTLLFDSLLGYALLGDRQRVHGCDVQRHVAGEFLELRRPGHEVRLAVHLDEDPEPAIEVDVRLDQALVCLPGALLGRDGLPALSEDAPGAVDVSVGLFKRPLHVHHPGGGLLPELFYLFDGTRQST